jgi:signal transduction histidine kinase
MKHLTRLPGLAWRGLTLQLFFIIILPLTALLLVIAFGSIRLHQNAMRTLVGERDRRAVRTAASALGAQISQRMNAIQTLSQSIRSADLAAIETVLEGSDHMLSDFDGGLAVFTSDGELLASNGDPLLWQAFLVGAGEGLSLKTLYPDGLAQGSNLSSAFPHPVNEDLFVAVSAQAPASEQGTGGVVLLGAFAPAEIARLTLEDAFTGHYQTGVIWLDTRKTLLYQNGPGFSDGSPQAHLGVNEALAGQSGASFLPAEDGEHVIAFAPVPPANWALVFEEPWEMVASPMLSYTQMAPLVLVPVLLLTLFALWFGVRQIVQPLQALEEQADALAWGDFAAIEKPVGGIAEIRHLQKGLIHLAHKVRAAQQSLRGYIGSITAAQEEERRRLARDLHDDTIQSLIALKQRVQLAQMDPVAGSTTGSFSELEDLAEKTIDNLRRVTRALRPIYLEDLGLLAALEMLAREVAQATEIQVEFAASGSERRLSSTVELALYRIAQEALNNTVRHAQASRAVVKLSFTDHLDQAVLLEVSDNGRGFDPPKSPADFAPGGHFGLLGIHERVELIGARLEISSSQGKGTRISVHLP